MDELMAVNTARGVQQSWDCLTSGYYGDKAHFIDVNGEEFMLDVEDDDNVTLVEEIMEEIVTNDTNDMEDLEAKLLDEDLYHPPPPQEDPKATMRMGMRKVLTTEQALKNFGGFKKTFAL